ncbi:hypothetical protein, partial [Collinsella aerofaciens]|uniref:hypothetical protein n=1 Tax=Collinsella aerofaciens TaxID=74426 RepID=UPI001E3C642C
PLGGLAKNKSKLDHFKWFDVCPDATQLVCPSSQYPVLKVHACAADPVPPGRAARRYIARPEGPCGTSIPLFTSPTQYIASYISHRKAGAEILHVSDDDPSVKRYIKIGHL